MTRRAWLAAIMAAGLAWAGPRSVTGQTSGAGEAPAPEPAAPAEATTGALPTIVASVDTAATAVGGRLRLILDVEIPEGWFVTPGEPSAEMGPFRARSLQETERTDSHRQFVFHLVATQAGDVEIPAVTMRATRGDDPDGIEIASAPVPVSVASNLVSPPAEADPANPAPGSAAAAEPAALKPPLEAPRDWRPVWIASTLR